MLHPSSDLFKFYDTELAAAAASFSIASIPQGGRAIVIRGALRSALAATSENLLVRFNGSAAANYNYLRGNLETTALWTAGSAFAATSFLPAAVAANTAPANVFSRVMMEIIEYDVTNKSKELIVEALTAKAFSAGNLEHYLGGGVWNQTARITSISVALSGGNNFMAGSRLTAYIRL